MSNIINLGSGHKAILVDGKLVAVKGDKPEWANEPVPSWTPTEEWVKAAKAAKAVVTYFRAMPAHDVDGVSDVVLGQMRWFETIVRLVLGKTPEQPRSKASDVYDAARKATVDLKGAPVVAEAKRLEKIQADPTAALVALATPNRHEKEPTNADDNDGKPDNNGWGKELDHSHTVVGDHRDLLKNQPNSQGFGTEGARGTASFVSSKKNGKPRR